VLAAQKSLALEAEGGAAEALVVALRDVARRIVRDAASRSRCPVHGDGSE